MRQPERRLKMALEYYNAIVEFGDMNDDVLFLQRQLHICGFNPGLKDGDFGNGTGNALENAQIYFGIAADRIAGPQTWRKLYDYCAKIQEQLNLIGGFELVIDGNVGSHGTATVEAFKTFQIREGRQPDWCCGPVEEQALNMVDFMKAMPSGNASVPSSSGLIVPTQSGRLDGVKIYIPAGHGGSDPGGVGNGLRESDVALAYATKLGNILQGYGATVLLGRTGDYYKSLASRVQEANNWGADLYISCHENAYGDPAANGSEVLFVSESGNQLAVCSVNELSIGLGTTNRGAKYQDDYEVVYSNMTAVICEPGFITNVGNAGFMNNDVGLQNQAQCLANGIVKYCA